MKVPRLEIYLSRKEGLCIAKVETQDAESRLIVNVPLEELMTHESADAAYRVGGTVLNILRLWHKQVFGDWEVPAVDGRQHENGSYSCALRLIDYALSAKTAIHNASIEVLLQQAATESEDARKYLDEAWPLLRDRLTGLDG